MNDTINDGGPAYPRAVSINNESDRMNRRAINTDGGMSLRDYLAAHSVQPGAGEIAAVAGLTYRLGGVWSDPSTRIAGFEEWFNGLPLDERLRLFACVKYAMADAMVAERARRQA